MKSPAIDEVTRTIETRLSHESLYPLIEELLVFFAKLRHLLWRELIIKKASINELKKYFIAHHGVTARQFNSLAKDVGGKALALEENRDELRSKLSKRIKATQATIIKFQRKIKVTQALLNTITTYRQRVKAEKEKPLKAGKIRKKPKMPAKIRGIFSDRLKRDLEKFSFIIHQKKRRLNILEQKMASLEQDDAPSLCFGGKAHFKKQFNLEKTDIPSHRDWLEIFRLRRSSSIFFLGSSDESAGNQTVQYDPIKKALRLRLPKAQSFAVHGTHLLLENIEFPVHLRDEFYRALSQPEESGRKNQKTFSPISYRIVRRVNAHTGERAYYLQASFNVAAPEISSRIERGAIGVDLNADHVALAETDRFGNIVDRLLIPFECKDRSTDQVEAILGDIAAVICQKAQESGKAIAIEELDFEEKKKALREQSSWRRRQLSSFAYGQFQKAMHTKARSQGIQLVAVNPAYTSLIGAYKYQGLKISSHEKAALAIARRAQGFSEGLKVFQGTLPTQAMMSERTKFQLLSRHVWGFYSDYRQIIRSCLIAPDKRSLLPVVRAFSLAKAYPSLRQSLFVTRESRRPEALRRASG